MSLHYRMLYLLIGAVIAGFADIDFNKETADWVMMLLLWPVAIILAVLAIVSILARAITRAIKGQVNG